MGYRDLFIVAFALVAMGCAATPGPSLTTVRDQPLTRRAERKLARQVRVFFRGDHAFARDGRNEWPIAEVSRDKLRWAPNGVLFAYVRKKSAHFDIVVRNVRGDSVNAFPVYRDGKPTNLDWVDDRQLAYLAPPDRSGPAYVVHAVKDGDILAVHRGRAFAWSPRRRRLAYVSGSKRQTVKIGDKTIWPRTPGKRRLRAHVVSDLVWSPDGNGLAFMERRAGVSHLVVLLVVDNAGGDLTWRLPKGAQKATNKLFWAGNKLIIGESKLKPRFAANWKRIQ